MKFYVSKPLPLKNVVVKDDFWSEYTKLVRETVIPYQWDALNDRIPDAEKSHAIANFRIAAGEEQGEFHGMVFQDSDVAKWLEAVAYSLETHPDPKLEALADETIDLIEKAQQPDGYLNTYFTIKEPERRWTNLYETHELYCAGHMIEAAVAYYKATGKRKLLDVMCRFADHIDRVFGNEPGKIKGYPGHQEIELALVKLYNVTGEKKYLDLAKYFIDERGKQPHFFDEEWEKRGRYGHWARGVVGRPNKKYNQSHVPVREQTEAVGHAVRAVYMYTGMADVALETGDESLMDACRRLWDNVTKRQMYITGGIGSTRHGEAFTFDYDLPNDDIYAETCASIALIFFGFRMLQGELKGEYGDVIERALYNIVLASMSKDGKHFFYVNPLEVWPEACEKNPGKNHVKPVRQKWFGCACCPPNVARLLASLGQYIYTADDNSLYTHLFIGSDAEMDIGGSKVTVSQETNYPWDGKVTLKLSMQENKEFKFGIRIPGWCKKASLAVNDESVDIQSIDEKGYAVIKRVWKDGDTVTLDLDMEPEFIQANPKVRADVGKVAIQRGPLVYCIEEVDNGKNLPAISIDTGAGLTLERDRILEEEIVVIKGKGTKADEASWSEELYRTYTRSEIPVDIKAVPYFIWGNRAPGEMLVWIRCK